MKKRASSIERLNQIALDVEFLLISVIQGVALATLAATAISPLATLQFQSWPYIFAAFLFILIFWSGAIIHAVSFIDWPIDLSHSFLYFLASLIEIMVITNLTNPLLWYIFMFVFQIVALGLYLYDLRLIKQHKKKLSVTAQGKKLYEHMLNEQQKELVYFIPASLVFNTIAIFAIVLNPQLFILGNYHLVFIFLQVFIAIVFLLQELKTFKKRSQLLSAS